MITKSRSFGWIAWALFLVPSTDLWVLGQTAGPAVSDSDLAAEIEHETGQPPQLVLDFVREHPYTRQALLDAAARAGVDVNTLAAIFFAEFNVKYFQVGQEVQVAEGGQYVTHTVTKDWNLLDGAEGGIDSFYMVGIDAFAEEAPQLKRRGLLPPALLFKRAGVFAPVEEQESGDEAVAQGEAGREVLGAIKKLAGVAK